MPRSVSCTALAAMILFGVGASGPAWQLKVHPLVLEETRRGPAEFLLVLAGQADLTPAARMPTKEQRGRFVHDALRKHARQSQGPLLDLLRAKGVEHRSLWIANRIWVRGDAELVERLASRPDVLRVDANPAVAVSLPEPSRPPEPRAVSAIEWNLLRIQADRVWALGYLGRGVVIGGQDTGYQWNHPALRPSYRGWDGVTATHDYHWHDAIHSGGGICGADASAPCDDSGHGTHTMGTMVGDDGGVERIGVAPGSRWIGCRNMDQGFGTPASYAECFQWFVAPTDLDGANPDPSLAPDVINNSWACPPFEGCAADTLRAVVENTRAAGIVVVSSAGNAGSECGTVNFPPAIYAASLSVGATDLADEIAAFSSRGPVLVDGSNRLKPDLSAPGVGIRSSLPVDVYGVSSGTSMAGPHVAGVVALLLEARPDLRGRVDEIEQLLVRSATPRTAEQDCGGLAGSSVPNAVYGHGRLDALGLLLGDADGDGADNLGDCAPLDGSAWSLPTPARELRLGAGTLLSWQPPLSPGAPSASYSVLRSPSAADFDDASCVVSGSSATEVGDPTVPSGIFYYLVRVENACGAVTGNASDGSPRATGTCP